MSVQDAGVKQVLLSEVTELIQYGYTAKSSRVKTGPKYLRITDIQNDHVDWLQVPHVSIEREHRDRYALQPQDIVFARTGATVGKSFFIESSPPHGAVFASYLIRLRCKKDDLDPKYAAYFFKSEEYWRQIREGAVGIGQPNFNGTKLGNLSVPLRPLNEQRCIVAKLDSLFQRSKSAREDLGRIPRLVERYKEAILAAAFRGELTVDWRQNHRHKASGKQLFADLVACRAKYSIKKKVEGRVEALDQPKGLHDLPHGWTWCPVAILASAVSDGVHKKPDYVEEGVPFLTVRNLTAGPGITLDGCRYVTQSDHEEFIKRTHPERGDLLISKDGTLGVVRAIRTDVVFSIFVSVALIKPADRFMTDYLELAFTSPQVQEQMVGVGTGLQHIHLTDLRRDFVPIAPTEERAEIVKRVHSAFAYIERLETETIRAAKLIDRLDHATLTKAFRGELVGKDPPSAAAKGSRE